MNISSIMLSTSLALLWATVAVASNTIQPHIIFILVDDLGFNDVPWHNPSVKMPNIEKLAKEGVILEKSYVLAVCTPTRSAFLTGRYPFTIGRQSSVLRPLAPTGLSLNVTLLPQALKKAGYRTHILGKWHLGFCKWDYTPTFRGFDSFLGYYVGSTSYFTHTRATTVKLTKTRKQHVTGYDLRQNTEPYYLGRGLYSTFLYSERAQEIILTHDSNRPLFLYLAFQAVHDPLEAPQKYIDRYSHIQNKDRKVYFGMLAALDDAVGNIVSTLKTSGLYNNSVIVFTSDNGGSYKMGGSNWPLKGHKSTLWEGGTRVPTFIHSPLLQQPGTVSQGLFHVVDWFPTLAGLSGAPIPRDLDGMDQFASLSTGFTPPREKFVYNIADNRGNLKAAIRVGDYKLVIGERRGNKWVPPPEEPNKVGDVGNNETNTSLHGNLGETADKYPSLSILHENLNGTVGEKDSEESREFPIPSLLDYDDREEDYSDDSSPADANVKSGEFILADLPDFEEKGENFAADSSLAEALNSVDCSSLTRKECRKHKRQLKTFKSLTRVEDFFERGRSMNLYDLASDPNEKQDLSADKPALVRNLLQELLHELPRVVVADQPARVAAGDPNNFVGVWSPGWC